MTSPGGTRCYNKETPFRIEYAGTDRIDPDSDGDRVRDGADDQDHDDVPNIVELSRNANTGRDFDAKDQTVGNPDPAYGRVAPFNPCLPFIGVADVPDVHTFRQPLVAVRWAAVGSEGPGS